MPSLNETFDLLFIDALKEEYSQYLDLGLPRLPGGVVIVDNLLWVEELPAMIKSLQPSRCVSSILTSSIILN